MQNVLTPSRARATSPGCQVTDLPGSPAGWALQLIVLAPGHAALWPAEAGAALWVVIDGLGKAQFDGAAQRIAAPCVLRQGAGKALQIVNQGSVAMRVVRWGAVAQEVEECADQGGAAAP